MRVFELLIEGNIEHVENEFAPDMFRNELLGKGTTARVYRSSKPNRVIKTLNIKNESDGTYRYIDMVMGQQANRFFPKIHSAKLYKYAFPHASKLVIEMEKLVPFQNAKTEHLFPMLMKEFNINMDDIKGHFTDDDREEYENDPNMNATGEMKASEVADLFHTHAGRKQLMSQISNEDLKNAIRLTGRLLDTPDEDEMQFYNTGDLHSENIMLRLTNNIPQLVIADPILTL